METYRIHAGVMLGENCQLGDWVIVGLPLNQPDQPDTVIGPGALIRSHTVIYAGNRIGSYFTTGHGVLIRELNQIGAHVSVGSHTIVEHHVQIADGVRIHSSAFVPEWSILEQGAWLGPHVVLTNARYPYSPQSKERLQGPRVGPAAKIGAHSTVLPGVVIGANALVGAGSVVVRDVPPGMIVAGNPARILRPVSQVSAYQASDLLGLEIAS